MFRCRFGNDSEPAGYSIMPFPSRMPLSTRIDGSPTNPITTSVNTYGKNGLVAIRISEIRVSSLILGLGSKTR